MPDTETPEKTAERIVRAWADNTLSVPAAIETVAAAIRAAYERAAQWHDQRARDTPDPFEMEFHQVSATGLRALARTQDIKQQEAKT